MRKFLWIFIAAILFLSCQNKKALIVIEGDIKGVKNEKVWLALITNEGLSVIDSMKMKDGHFHFELKAVDDEAKARASSPMMYQIMLSPYNTLTTLAQGGDHITIKANAESLVDGYHITGGEEAVLMGQLDSALFAFVQPSEALYHTYQQNIEDDSARAKVEQQYVQLLDHHKQFLQNFIKQHPDKMASYVAFYQSYNRRSFFDEHQDKTLLEQITHNLKKQYPESPYVKNMQRRLEMLGLMEQERNSRHDTH
ncbi:MAG: DUF4369 domain-containing protein [Bacteroidales bacterium]|nr:DUF4369 domain-containing protein [Bacteroidales bacterium]